MSRLAAFLAGLAALAILAAGGLFLAATDPAPLVERDATISPVAIAQARLPDEVKRIGVTVAKNSPDMLMVIHLSSPDASRDQLYLSNYATLQIMDVLSRLHFSQQDGALRLRPAHND